MAETSIEWAEHVWNPIVGCSVVSPGCTNCYAMKMAARLEAMGQPRYAGLTKPSKAGAVWTGEMRLVEEALTIPLRRRKPTTYFVNSMSDLFHESVPDEWIDRVFAVMALAPQHTFQVLTKRSARMRQWFEERWQPAPAQRVEFPGLPAVDVPAQNEGDDRHERVYQAAGEFLDPEAAQLWNSDGSRKWPGWPLPHVWLGVSAEDQRRADERRADHAALAAQGWITFASYEPALEPVDWAGWEFLSQLISGGESGPRARATHPAWHRAARDFCDPYGIAYFFKQWGEWQPREWCRDGGTHAMRDHGGQISFQEIQSHPNSVERVGAGPDWQAFARVGKKAAGRLLDGVEHNGFPSSAPLAAE